MNIIQIFGAALSIFVPNNSVDILIGFGCMLAFIHLGRYLEYNKNYSTIYETIKRGLPNIIRYLIGVFPIFFGFVLFGN